jgi:hypothetical protein
LAEAVGRRPLAVLNRPGGRIVGRLRIDNGALAYVASCIAATTLIGGVWVLATIGNVARRPDWPPFDWSNLVATSIVRWIILTMAGAVLAAPFVPTATWIGARLRIESALYYAGLGAAIMAALALLLAGPPRESPFGTAIAAWMFGPPCGAAMGFAWWYLHRRWRSR